MADALPLGMEARPCRGMPVIVQIVEKISLTY